MSGSGVEFEPAPKKVEDAGPGHEPPQKAPESVKESKPISEVKEQKKEMTADEKQTMRTRLQHIIDSGAAAGKSLFGQEISSADKQLLVKDWATVAEDYGVRVPKWLHLVVTVLVTFVIIHKTYKNVWDKVTAAVQSIQDRLGGRKKDKDGGKQDANQARK
jgi:predicted unusual protein kinase regulating ubiquinone biosynthesis (AarF/ABC1/UbiB family)